MLRFEAVIGAGRKTVTVEFDVDDYGQFKYFYVVASFNDGPQDIAGYLSTYEIDFLQFQCQTMYREKAVNRHEAIISRTALEESLFTNSRVNTNA